MTRYYVTITWDDFPEGGTYGDIVEAETAAEAEQIVRLAMGASRAEERDLCDRCGAQRIAEEYGHAWHLIDCWDVDAFIRDLSK